MPVHDWSRVTAGTFHDFHVAWIAELRNALNGGLLPPDYYAMAEQIVGPFGPDVVALQFTNGDGAEGPGSVDKLPRPAHARHRRAAGALHGRGGDGRLRAEAANAGDSPRQ